MTRLTAQHLLADTVDTTLAFASEDARRMAELEAALHPERAAMRANSERIRIAKAPQPPPSAPLPQPKDEPMPPVNDQPITCSRPGCTRTLRSDNKKGVCSDRKVCGGTGSAPSATKDDGDDFLMGEEREPSKPAGRVGPIQRKHLERPTPRAERTPVAGDVETRFRTVAEALGFDPDDELDTLMEGWLAEIRGHVDAARGPRDV